MSANHHTVLLLGAAARTSAWRQQLDTNGTHQVVASAASGREAKLLVKQHDPDIIVSDLQLDDGPALDLLRALRQGTGHAGTMILMVAPTAEHPQLLQCLSNGADSYYVDGGPGPTLASRIDEMVKGEAKMSPEIAAKVLAHFRGTGRAQRTAQAIDEILNPLALNGVERLVLVRLSQGESVPEIARAENLSIHHVAKCIRALYRKMSWDLKADGLALELI